MKFYKRLNKYKASNVEFCLKTKQAYSYGWWKFTDLLSDGKTILFNTYNYSSTTSRHQYKISKLFHELNYTKDYSIVYISSPKSIGAIGFYESAIDYLNEQIDSIESILQNSRRKKSLDVSRYKSLQELREKLAELNKLKTQIKGV